MHAHIRTLALSGSLLLPCAGALEAQRPADVIRYNADARVGAVMSVRRATYPTFERTNASATTAVLVGANVAHDVMVRLDDTYDGVIEVRDENGDFRRLLPRERIRVATGAPGSREVVVSWRAIGLAAGRAPISYSVTTASDAVSGTR